jgi:hypothetical protein
MTKIVLPYHIAVDICEMESVSFSCGQGPNNSQLMLWILKEYPELKEQYSWLPWDKYNYKEDNMVESRYYVWSPGSGEPTKFHPTIEDARMEARRLCQLNAGMEFFVLRAIESVKYRTDPFVCRNYSRRK